jgi:hypothetical protein
MAIDKITTPAIADGAVSADTVTSTVITGQTAETSIATDDLILLSDTSASGALKKMTRANFVSGIGGTNTPAFHAVSSSGQSLSSATSTKINFGTETFDVGSNFASSRFTPTTAGKYFCYSGIDSSWTGSVGGRQNATHFYKNGSSISSTYKHANWSNFYTNDNLDIITTIYLIGVIEFNGSGDYLEIFHYSNASSPSVAGCFGGYKIIE